MNESDVRRVLSEKKEGYNVEAGGILHDVKYDLECAGIEKVRVINRYDVSGITDEEYEKAKNIVFSEPPVDTVSDETVDLSGAAYVLIIESLPGQYDQRADSAAQCIQFLTQKERPLVKCARIVAFYGSVSEDDKEKEYRKIEFYRLFHLRPHFHFQVLDFIDKIISALFVVLIPVETRAGR